MFLSEDGVAEVQIDNDNPQKMQCTCPQFRSSSRCKHAKHIKTYMAKNHGHYTVTVPEEIDEDVVLEAMETSESMREFIIRHARVEVL